MMMYAVEREREGEREREFGREVRDRGSEGERVLRDTSSVSFSEEERC